MRPTDDQLRRYLRCTLPQAEHDTVGQWVRTDPDAPARLARVEAAAADRLDGLLGELNAPAEPPAAADPFPPAPPGFEITKKLGEGGMGVVYLARQPALNRRVALKVIRGGAVQGAALLRFLGEAQAVAAARHPNVAEIYHTGDHLGQPYQVLEYCEKGDLAQYVSHVWLRDDDRFREVAGWVAQVAAGVNAAHARGIVHRDLKPANILLTADDTPKVSDFGLAKHPDGADVTRSDAVLGTPAYMSPEQAGGGAKFVGPPADVWSLGVILYELLTGARPFIGADDLAVRDAIINGRFRHPRAVLTGVPRDLEAIVLKCLDPGPGERYPTAGDLADDLRNWLAGKPTVARPVGVVGRAVKWVRRNPKATLTAAGVAAGAALGLTVLVAALVWGVAERDTRVHEATVAEARALTRRGDWTAAMPAYERAISHHRPDERALRVERLYGYFAANDLDALDRECRDHLLDPSGEPRADLGALAPRVYLIRGARLLCDSARQDEGRKLVKRALERRSELGSDADIAFAEALADTRPRPTVEALRRAVAADPLHYPAHECLCVALLASGQPAAAKAQAERLAELFPASEVPPLVNAVVALLNGEPVPPSAKPVATAKFLAAFARVLALMDQVAIGPRGQVNLPPNLQAEVAALFALIGTADRPFWRAVPTVHLCWQWVEPFMHMSGCPFDVDALDGQYAVLAEQQKDTFDAFDLLQLGLNRFLAGTCVTEHSRRPADAADRFAVAADLFHAAADAPTLIDRFGYRYLCRCMGVVADLSALKLSPDDDATRWRRVRDALPRIIADGRHGPSHRLRGEVIALLVAFVIDPLHPHLRAGWRAETDPGRAALRERERQLVRLAERLLDLWADDDPTADVTNPRAALDRWVKSDFALDLIR